MEMDCNFKKLAKLYHKDCVLEKSLKTSNSLVSIRKFT